MDYEIPIYIFDNHNHVFYAWCEARGNAKCKRKNEKSKYWNWSDDIVLVHMDAYFDAKEPPNYNVNISDLGDVWTYTNEVLQIATYIKPALELGIFSECINHVESNDFDVRRENLGDVVINIDMDFFHQDMNHISWKEKIDVLKYYLPQTKLITMATSPSFIDQNEAIELIKRLLKELFNSV